MKKKLVFHRVLIILLFLFSPTENVFPQTIDFSNSYSFAVGTEPSSVAIGDLNGDGKQDIVVTNYLSNTLSIFFNRSREGAPIPSFSPRADFSTGNGPLSAVIGDLNGDGKPDIVVANSNDNTVSVYLNTTPNGASTPSFSARTSFATGAVPCNVALADLNTDGKLDIVTSNSSSGNISVLMNTTPNGSSSPTFSAKTDFATGTNPASVTIADLNDDGKPDIVTANYGNNTISVLMNTTPNGSSSPTFSAKTDFATGTNPASVAIADLNGDGKSDIVVANFGSNTVSVLLNTTPNSASTPSFSGRIDFTTGAGPTAVAISDLNEDGKPDIVTANYNAYSVSVLLNTNRVSTLNFSAATNFLTGNNPRGVAIADINGDNKPDIVTINEGTNIVSMLLNGGNSVSVTNEFVKDKNFSGGIGIVGLDSNGNHALIDTLYPFGKEQSDVIWALNTGGSRFSLAGAQPEYFGDTVAFADSGARVAFSPINGDTQASVDMEVFGSAEYPTPRTSASEVWAGIYLSQSFRIPLRQVRNVTFGLSARLMYCENMDSATYNPSINTAQFFVQLTVQNLNPNSSHYGDLFWLGLGLYDYRYYTTQTYAAPDFGPQSTGKFIYNPASNELFNGSFHDGQWINISKDILPLILQGFQVSQARGYLQGSSITDMYVSGCYFGWEIPGTFNAGFTFHNLGITASELVTSVTSVRDGDEKNKIPPNFSLSQNYPNPFNPSTVIKYSVPKSGIVTLKVYNMLGQEVATLVNQMQKSGNYIVNFKANKLASGIYVYRIQSGDFSLTRKMMLLK